MRLIATRIALASVLSCFALVAFTTAQSLPAPPVKPGLWEVKSSALDGNGREVPPPEQAAFAQMTPEMRARMAEMMKARGASMPDASGAMKTCFAKETLESGRWQQTAADMGCTTKYSGTSGNTWKWHSSCPAPRPSEADGEIVFTNPESYRVKVTMTTTVAGKPTTSVRLMQAKWLGTDCGDIKPFTPPTPPRK